MMLTSAFVLLLAQTVAPAQAKDHVGKEATVCGRVVSTRYASTSRNQPTFLNFEKPYPDQTFTVVIFHEHRHKFGKPEETYRDKEICASGKVGEYQEKPQIVATEPSQLVEAKPSKDKSR